MSNNCKDHPRYDGFGNRPRTGCPVCWLMWLDGATPTEADAKYIARMQSYRLELLKRKTYADRLSASNAWV